MYIKFANPGHRPAPANYAILLILSWLTLLVLTACGDSANPTPTDKKADLPLDRALILSNRDGWPDLYTVDLTGKITGRLTNSPAAEYGAHWSPDGKKVVFTELSGDQASGDYARQQKLVVIDADGQNRREIAQNGFNPVWSPDSQKVLFTRLSQVQITSRANPNRFQTDDILAAPTATPRPLPQPTVQRGIQPVPTQPGGGLPLPVNPPDDATVIPLPSGTPVALPPADTEPLPTPAPTGTSQAGQANLYLTSIDNPQPVVVAQNAVAGVWSPDGKRIAYLGGNNQVDKKRTLNLVNADGNGQVSMTDRAKLTDLDILYVAWSPDGNNLAFTASDAQKNKTTLYRLSPDGSSARRLTDYDGSARELASLVWGYGDYFNPASRLYLGPAWSPNSRYIAFSDGSARLSVVDAESGNVRYFPVGSAALGQDKDSVLTVSWLPDNRRLLYDRASAGRNALLSQANNYIYDYFNETLETLDTLNKNTLSLATVPGGAFAPTCCGMDLLGAGDPAATPAPVSPTAQPTTTDQADPAVRTGKLVYVSGVSLRQLVVSDLKTGSQKVISSGPFKLIDYTLSPKGNQLLYVEVSEGFNSKLYLSSLDGQQKVKLSEGGGNPDDLSYVANWSPDGKHIAFQALNNDPNLKSGLYTLTIDDKGNPVGSPQLLTSQNASSFAWSPDNRYIAFKVDSAQYELWVAPIDGSQREQRLAALGRFDTRYSSLGRGLLWSPNGRYMVLSGAGGSSYGELWQVWLVTPQGQVIEQPSYYINRLIGFSPDSSRLIATVASTGQSSSIQALLMPTANNGGRGWRSYDRGFGPLISPDSASMAYYNWADDGRTSAGQSSTLSAWYKIQIINLANGISRPVNLNFVPYYAFKARFYSWDPTGKYLAFYENNTIYLANSQGSQQRPEILARAFVVDRLTWIK